MYKKPMKVLLCLLLCAVFTTNGVFPMFASAAVPGEDPAGSTEERLVVTKYDGLGRVLTGIDAGATVGNLSTNFGGYDLVVTVKLSTE